MRFCCAIIIYLHNGKFVLFMVRITIFTRASSAKKQIKIRLRLTEGRRADLFHKTDIRADVADIQKFGVNCKLKDGIKIYDHLLYDKLQDEVHYMENAFEKMLKEGMDLTNEVFKRVILEMKNPIVEVRRVEPGVVSRFNQYIDCAVRDGIFGENRAKHIRVVCGKLDRFLTIKGLSKMTITEFDQDTLMEFRNFILDEYLYVDKNKRLYKDFVTKNLPKERLSANTAASQMKMLQSFFTDLENRDEITKSPFRKLGADRKKAVMKTTYDAPVFLRKEEFQKVLTAKLPASLEPTRDAFVLQTALGCRVDDFQHMSMDNVGVSDDNIPYIHYLPHKTAGTQENNSEVVTPIVRFAFDVIKRTGFNLPALKNLYGEMGYNAKIKGILSICKIDRKVPVYDESEKRNIYLPVSSLGSSKLARKTHVDLMNKIQIDMYAAGLHKVGSGAVKRYTSLELKDRFAIVNLAFDQQPYSVDEQLNIMGE